MIALAGSTSMFVAKIGSTTKDCRERKMLSVFISSGFAPPNLVSGFELLVI